MKKIVCVCFIFILSVAGKSQLPNNMTLTLLPASPTTSDNIKVICEKLFYSTPCSFVSGSVTSNNFLITVSAYHNNGLGAATCTSKDTITLGNYPPGTYKLVYNVLYTGSGALVSKDSLNFVIAGAVSGLNKMIDMESAVKTYPNPTDQFVNIEVTNGTLIRTIKIYDLTGKLVKTFLSTETKINIEDLIHGRYLLKIITNKGTYTESIIKQ